MSRVGNRHAWARSRSEAELLISLNCSELECANAFLRFCRDGCKHVEVQKQMARDHGNSSPDQERHNESWPTFEDFPKTLPTEYKYRQSLLEKCQGHM